MTSLHPKFIESFCGQVFLDWNETFDRDVPDVNQCFQHTTLVWIPCLFLLIFSPFLIYSFFSSKRRPRLQWSRLIVWKALVSAVLAADALVLLFSTIAQSHAADSDKTAAVWFVYPALLAISTGAATALLIICRMRGVITSGVLFIFWLLLTVCGLPEFSWWFRNETERNNDVLRFVLYMIWYPLVVIQLVLSAIADTPQESAGDIKEQKEKACPELQSSFLNQISFHWFNDMAILGNRRPLETSDLWALNNRDASKTVVPRFESHWLPKLKKFLKSQQDNTTTVEADGKESVSNKSPAATDEMKHELPNPSLYWPLFKTFKGHIISGFLFKFSYDCLQFVSPQLLSLLISFIEDPARPLWQGIGIALLMSATALLQTTGIGIALLMSATALLQTTILHQYFHAMFRLGMNLRSVLTAAVFTKALRLSNSVRKNRTTGEIVNLMSVDVQRFQDMTNFMMLFWSAPFQVILSIYFLWGNLGPSVLAGIAVLLAFIPINSFISIRMRRMQVEQMKLKDARLNMMSEVLNGIKVLKLYAWEPSMEKMVLDIRRKEVKNLKKLAILDACNTLTWASAPFLVAVASFGAFVLSDPENHILTPSIMFVSLSLFNILRFPLAMIASIVSQAVQLSVSNKRLKSFLYSQEMDQNAIERGSTDSPDAVVVQHGTFAWEKNATPTLCRINLAVPRGKLIGIVGKVGCGKSSILSAMLGEMDKIEGKVSIRGSVAYSAQQAWIQNLTLKQNVLFGLPYDQAWYNKVVDACALRPDFDTLPAGDETEIGEKGINLSGGQKQRVSLARAVYQQRDIILLDDPLSAVDAHVGKHLFHHVIGNDGLLAGRTRVLVTHGMHYLPHFDHIVVLKDGAISESGTYKELISNAGAFAEFLEEHVMEQVKKRTESCSEQVEEDAGGEVDQLMSELAKHNPNYRAKLETQLSRISVQSNHSEVKIEMREKSGSILKRKPSTKIVKESKLIQKEKTETGKVNRKVYGLYLKAIGYAMTLGFIFIYILSSVLGVLSNLWLANWSDDSTKQLHNESMSVSTPVRLSVYTVLGTGQAGFVCFASIVMTYGMVRASKLLHEGLLHNLMRSSMSFFDITPLGRILNRVGKDVDVLDTTLPSTIRSFLTTITSVFMTLIVIIIATPIFAVVILPLAFIYIIILRFYVSTSRQLKRMESVTRSPIYSHFHEAVQGAISIRAYGASESFMRESEHRVDTNLINYYPSICANRWLAVRLEIVGNAIVLFAALSAVLFRDNGSVTAGLVGLSVSYALGITQTLNWAVRMASDLETNIVAVERIKEYSETPTEAALEAENEENRPPSDWPSHGEIEFDNYQLRYRAGLDPVLKGISVNVKAQEKVGIVGRTGAGKSSLTLALFRIIEADGGRILIDGRDISKMGLHDLRRQLTIVPQDPVLFSGSLRINLDPFQHHADDAVWSALEHAHLKSFVSAFPDGLSHEITEGGENLSVGQRQLVCLARALLRKTKVLVLDEAAAAVDMETDALIQSTIRDKFSDCTVLTIAHRLNTVMDYDRILVLDQGRVAEFDTPQRLMADKTSLFSEMAANAGIHS
uniref:ABC-type glutathione-S-conjugate transporter n=1 Tax=Plectus sambesii TaxID=2011161 RepID=A0A914VV15_9BILA